MTRSTFNVDAPHGAANSAEQEMMDLLSGYQIEPHKEAMMSPKKYYRGESISAAWLRSQQKNPEKEYEGTCQKMKSRPNSRVTHLLKENTAYFANQEVLNFSDNFLGEKGFIALLPLLNGNTIFTHLNASGNGLRNEAVCHLVDMLLRPKHADRPISLDLSRNPISSSGYAALAVLAARHPTLLDINVRRTQIPRRKIIQLRDFMASKRLNLEEKEREKDVLKEQEKTRSLHSEHRRGLIQSGEAPDGEDVEVNAGSLADADAVPVPGSAALPSAEESAAAQEEAAAPAVGEEQLKPAAPDVEAEGGAPAQEAPDHDAAS